METKAPATNREPSVVYDVRMPSYHYRDDRGESRTVGVERPKADSFKLDCLANFTLA